MSSHPLYLYYLEILESIYSGNFQCRNSTSILSAFIALAKFSPGFIEILSSKFAENHFSSTVQTFLTTNHDSTLPDLKCTVQSCPRHRARIQHTINISLCQLILRLGFLPKAFLEHSTLVLALEKLTYLSSITRLLECTVITHKPVLPVLLEELATQ